MTYTKTWHMGKGPLQVLLRDSAAGSNLNKTIENLQKGTDGFNQNMETLKHKFLFKGYLKRHTKARSFLINDNPSIYIRLF